MWAEILQVIGLVAFSSVKFLFAPSTVYAFGYNWFETIGITILGGWSGVLIFFYAGSYIFDWWTRRFDKRDKKKRVFRKRNRLIITVKNKYGIVGLAVVSPSLISIPLGCLLAAKYFRHDKRTIPIFFSAVVFWSLTLTTITTFVGPVFAQ